VLAIGFFEPMPTQETIDLIQKYHIGNIILFKRNIQGVQQVYELTQYLQRLAREAGHRQPLLIMIDQENGMVRRFGQSTTIFPGNMALGAIGSDDIAYAIAEATGRELRALGINMNLAPDVDVNNNAANPVIGVRSFGEDPQLVAYLAEHAVPLEVCPTSNVCLGVYPSLAAHPFPRLYAAGVPITVNSDDPPLFNTTLTILAAPPTPTVAPT